MHSTLTTGVAQLTAMALLGADTGDEPWEQQAAAVQVRPGGGPLLAIGALRAAEGGGRGVRLPAEDAGHAARAAPCRGQQAVGASWHRAGQAARQVADRWSSGVRQEPRNLCGMRQHPSIRCWKEAAAAGRKLGRNGRMWTRGGAADSCGCMWGSPQTGVGTGAAGQSTRQQRAAGGMGAGVLRSGWWQLAAVGSDRQAHHQSAGRGKQQLQGLGGRSRSAASRQPWGVDHDCVSVSGLAAWQLRACFLQPCVHTFDQCSSLSVVPENFQHLSRALVTAVRGWHFSVIDQPTN
jgi:hypothetical protein